jgi:allantoin racemase
MDLLYIVVDDVNVPQEEAERLRDAGQQHMPDGDAFHVSSVAFGPSTYYESAVGLGLCVPALLDVVLRAQASHDAMLIGCFVDPGLRAAREISSVPILGGGEAAFLFSQLVSRRFGVVTIEDTDIPEIHEYLRTLGHEQRCVGINAIGMPYHKLVHDPVHTLDLLTERSRPLLAAGAEAVILGCMSFGFYPFGEQLSDRLGVPVLDGVRSGIAAAMALRILGTGHSPRWVPKLDDRGALDDFLGSLVQADSPNGRNVHG